MYHLGVRNVKVFYNCQLAISPINWTNDDMHDLGDHYSFEQIVDDMCKLGFRSTELGRKFPREVQRLRAELGTRGLTLTSGWCDVLFSDPECLNSSLQQFFAHALFLRQMGCRFVVTADGGGSLHWDPREDRSQVGVRKYGEREWASLARGLHVAGQFCRLQQMTLVYHVHAGTGVETMEEIDRLCANTDPEYVSLLVDTGHLHYCGLDPAEVISKYRTRVKYVHLKDVRQSVLDEVRARNIHFNGAVRMGVFTVPGDGIIDFERVMDSLCRIEYQGWMVIEAEQDSRVYDPVQYAQKALQYLQSFTNLRP
ncbi:MAG: myo-inosose-2 dehydratase [Alicyclobacillus sp.]|nr:myo-inosose-2 dehydratase [Alicyclobacillus sp.]